MKICLFNDLHLEFSPFNFPSEDTYDVMIWAGDIFPIKKWLEGDRDATRNIPRDKPIYYVVGNHEYYHSKFDIEPLREYLSKEFSNITLLEDEWVRLNDKVVLYGMTMWTNFNNRDVEAMNYAQRRMNDYKYIYAKTDRAYNEGISWERRSIIPAHTADKHDDSMRAFRESETDKPPIINFAVPPNLVETYRNTLYSPAKIIMVTHHSPLLTKDQNPRDDVLLNPAYIAQDAVALMDENDIDHQIVVWCHGHTHEFRDEMYKNTRILSNARGYNGLEYVHGFKPEGLIFEV